MNDQLAALLKQRGKNLTLLVLCGTVVAVVHPDSAAAIMTAVCLAVGGPMAVENWPKSGGSP